MRQLLLSCFIIPTFLQAQVTLEDSLILVQEQLRLLNLRHARADSILKELKLRKIRKDIHALGLPFGAPHEELIEHAAMVISYNEEHEQANWVMHVILTDIIFRQNPRVPDFRIDPGVGSGSAADKDYFLKTHQKDSAVILQPFGYDRAQLAPAADFRWSEKALSESYYYSNVSPQLPEFHAGPWADLESNIRGYVYTHRKNIFVVTGPLLHDKLPKVNNSETAVSVPEYFYKVVLDHTGPDKQGIGFVLPHQETHLPLEAFACSIDSVESLTGYDFFPGLSTDEEVVESTFEVMNWIGKKDKGDVEPIGRLRLPRGALNTIEANGFKGSNRKVQVCGTVVSGVESQEGHIFLNLDKRYPEQLFTILILQENRVNFASIPHEDYLNLELCVSGRILDFEGKATMIIKHEKQLRLLNNY
jgi:endonuclease G